MAWVPQSPEGRSVSLALLQWWRWVQSNSCVGPPHPAYSPTPDRSGHLRISLHHRSSISELIVQPEPRGFNLVIFFFFFFFLYLLWILATYVRKKHSLRWRQPKLCSSFVHDVSKHFAEAALRHPSSLLPPERVASLNFSWCKTSDCNRTSAIGSFTVELWTIFRENIK